MSHTQGLVDDGTSRDPAVGLRAVAALRRLVERLEDLQVQNARSQGWFMVRHRVGARGVEYSR
jgi:hypothetical protein